MQGAQEDSGTQPKQSSPDTGLSCLVLLGRFLGVAANAGQLQHLFGRAGKVFGEQELFHAAKYLKLKAKTIASDWDKLQQVGLPAIGQTEEGGFFIVARCRGHHFFGPQDRRNRKTPGRKYQKWQNPFSAT